MNTSARTKAVTEGAMMAVLTALLALTGIYIPLLNVFTNLVWTTPVVLVTVRHGLLTGVLSLAVAVLLIFMLASPVTAVYMLLLFGGLALVYGLFFHKGVKPGITLACGAVTVIISFLAASAFSFLVTGINPFDLTDALKESVDGTIALYRELGLFERYGAQGVTEATVRQMLQGFVEMMIRFMPALLAVYGLMVAFINYFISQKILHKLKTEVPPLTPFMCWRLPWWTIWGFIFGFGASLAGPYLHNQALADIGANIVMIYSPVLFVLGLSVASFFLHKKLKGERIYRIFLILFILFFFRIAVYVLTIIGVADMLFNYRRLPEKNQTSV